MFDFLRDLTKSAEEKRQEQLNAYLDGELSPNQQSQFEAELSRDEALQSELQETRLLKQNLQALPRRRAPRNFTLDPARYGRPEPQPLFQLYPVLRGATALTAFFFIVALAAGLLTSGGMGMGASAPAADVAMQSEAAEAPLEDVVVTYGLTPEAETAEGAADEAVMAEPMTMEAIEAPAEEVEEAAEEVVEEEEMEAEAAADEEADSAGAAPEPESEDTAVILPTPTLAPLATQPPAAAEALTVTPPPTATPSQLPRMNVEATEEARAMELETLAEVVTAVPPAATVPVPSQSTGTPTPWLTWAIVGLGLLLIVLTAVTLLIRSRL